MNKEELRENVTTQERNKEKKKVQTSKNREETWDEKTQNKRKKGCLKIQKIEKIGEQFLKRKKKTSIPKKEVHGKLKSNNFFEKKKKGSRFDLFLWETIKNNKTKWSRENNKTKTTSNKHKRKTKKRDNHIR